MFKTAMIFLYTDWFLRILVMALYNPCHWVIVPYIHIREETRALVTAHVTFIHVYANFTATHWKLTQAIKRETSGMILHGQSKYGLFQLDACHTHVIYTKPHMQHFAVLLAGCSVEN